MPDYPQLPKRLKQRKALYFSHTVGLRNMPSIRAVRKRFGNSGAAVVMYILETLAGCDDFTLEVSRKQRKQMLLDFEIPEKSNTQSGVMGYEELMQFCTSDEVDIFQLYQNGKTSEKTVYIRSTLLEEDLLYNLKGKREANRNSMERQRVEGQTSPRTPPEYKAKPKDVSMILEYMKTRDISNPEMEAKNFWDYYKAIGWVVGKLRKPMKDWKSAVRLWEKNIKKWGKGEDPKPFDKNNPF